MQLARKKSKNHLRALYPGAVKQLIMIYGIGDPGDLFEALIIYTRVLGGYYDAVYNFNISVAELNRVFQLTPWTGKHLKYCVGFKYGCRGRPDPVSIVWFKELGSPS